LVSLHLDEVDSVNVHARRIELALLKSRRRRAARLRRPSTLTWAETTRSATANRFAIGDGRTGGSGAALR
jgi:hypothetical protein